MNEIAHALIAFEVMLIGASAVVGGSVFAGVCALLSDKPRAGFLPSRETGIRIGAGMFFAGLIIIAICALCA